MWKWAVGMVLLIAMLLDTASGISRDKRSPFKKHKIIVNEEDVGWGAPAPPPPQQETIVEHHHHWDVAPPPPNPPPPIQYQPPAPPSHSVVIEVHKGGHDGKLKEEKIQKFKQELDSTFEALERDKQEKLEAFKKDAEAKLDALAQIPHMIASDIDFIGKKILEDLEKKKHKDEGISIQIWKGKGQGSTVHGGSSSSSHETVHHHHYYNEQPPQRQPPPPPSPPRKQYYGGDDSDPLEPWYKIADVGTGFIDFLAGGGTTQYKVPVAEEGSRSSSGYESGEGWQQGGGGKGKGFRVSVWKSKGFRRRK